MSDIIDLSERRAAKDRPDADLVRLDDSGSPLYLFFLQYEMGGSQWGGVDVWAYSFEDAENRVRAMRQSLVLLGQAYSIIPA
jgi:hypothetical protein